MEHLTWSGLLSILLAIALFLFFKEGIPALRQHWQSIGHTPPAPVGAPLRQTANADRLRPRPLAGEKRQMHAAYRIPRTKYRPQRTGNTAEWTPEQLDILVAWHASKRPNAKEMAALLRCSPNTLQRKIEEHRAAKTVDTPKADAVAEDAARAQRVAREISAHKVYPTKPKGVLEELPADVLQLAHT
jgi:hypothetical protein